MDVKEENKANLGLLEWMQNEPLFNIDDPQEILDDYNFYKSNLMP